MLDVLMFVAAAGLAGAIGTAWVHVIRLLLNGQSPVAWEQRRPARWGLLDVVLAIFLLLFCTMVAMGIVNARFGLAPGTPIENAPMPYQTWLVLAQSLASLVTMSASMLFIIARCHVSLRDLGFDRRAIWRDVRLGVAAFFLLAPPTYGLQLVLVQWFKSSHPVVELIREHPDPGLIVASVFSAAIVAPIFEEYLFRGLVQGWLERFYWIGESAVSLIWGRTEPAPQPPVQSEQSGPEPCPPDLGTHPPQEDPQRPDHDGREPFPWCAYSPPSATGSPSPEIAANAAELNVPGGLRSPRGILGFLPILVSASIFAALHISHGPDWIPLFFLAVGLGYLYRQTNRLLPCIVVHFLLNGVSMGMFLVAILEG